MVQVTIEKATANARVLHVVDPRTKKVVAVVKKVPCKGDKYNKYA